MGWNFLGWGGIDYGDDDSAPVPFLATALSLAPSCSQFYHPYFGYMYLLMHLVTRRERARTGTRTGGGRLAGGGREVAGEGG